MRLADLQTSHAHSTLETIATPAYRVLSLVLLPSSTHEVPHAAC
jgi:hypothetical protein